MTEPHEVEAALRRAVEMNPADATQWNLLGSTLVQQGKSEEAAAAYRQALALDDCDALAWSNLGAAEWAAGHLAEADAAYARSLAISRENPAILTNYARLLTELQQPERALKLLEEVLNRDPSKLTAWLAAGNALQVWGDMDQAAAAYRRALALSPSHQGARYSLALLLIHHGSLTEAEPLVDTIVADDPQSANAWAIVAALRQKQLRDRDAAAALQQAIAIAPGPEHHSNLLQTTQYFDDVSPEGLLVAHRQWEARYAAHLFSNPPPVTEHHGDGRLRLGFVSADFGRHPTGFLALRPIECLDKTQCSVTCYYDLLPEDEYTVRFRAAADDWRVVRGWSNQRLAEQIARDKIDVLFDLMGHTGTRLLAFARKPAPLQVTWLGYVGTTGLAAMDHLLADRFHVRPGEESYYVEKVLRMPNGYACYGPPPLCPDVGPLPAQSEGPFTFGCFNNAAKLSLPILDAWAEILRLATQSRLLIKNRSLSQPELRDRLHVHFAQHGIPPQRILLEQGSPHQELLASYGRVDLALDTQPYSGGLTTCEALWMGVPVVTFPGKTFAGRHSVSHMATAGFGQFVAPDLPGYIDLAVSWAGRLAELAAIRRQMRDHMRRSPLCDAPRFAGDLLAVLRQAWEAHSHRRRQDKPSLTR
jgi:predicted O-linked N-acetylglucosamine transferase (SPINDLY family)